MSNFFQEMASYFRAVCRIVLWFPILVFLLFFSYCIVRWIGRLYEYVNRSWFYGNQDHKVGEQAPEFNGTLADGKQLSLGEFRGRSHVILYFFPKDFTPG